MNLSLPPSPCWHPFVLAPRAELTRSIKTPEGIGDRLRIVAFAELQAREAFLWASRTYPSAPESLKRTWVALSLAENRHFQWLMTRMKELHISIEERAVSEELWLSLVGCSNEKDFSWFMASAEERGRQAGLKFYRILLKEDPQTANIFYRIAEEEKDHIAVAKKYFGNGV